VVLAARAAWAQYSRAASLVSSVRSIWSLRHADPPLLVLPHFVCPSDHFVGGDVV